MVDDATYPTHFYEWSLDQAWDWLTHAPYVGGVTLIILGIIISVVALYLGMLILAAMGANISN